jgi:large subunit ribosomal protein L4
MKKDVLDTKGNKLEQITLDKSVFGGVVHEITLAQYLRVYLANQRQGTASTKTRSEVSGSGKKPWRQKGTGRARVGTKRNPIWRHGGVAHGPKPKDWGLDLNKRARKLAIKSALTQVLSSESTFIINEFNLQTPKTKDAVKALEPFNLEGRTLLVLDKLDENISKGLSNIENISFAMPDNLNAYSLVNAKNVIFTKEAIQKLTEKYK